MPAKTETLLKAERVGIRFGGIKALDNLTFAIARGQLMGLIGPNGAGKTTAFNILSGVYQPTHGTIEFAGEKLQGQTAYELNRRGIARTFQNIRLFAHLSVLDNVLIAAQRDTHYRGWDALFNTRRFREGEAQLVERARTLLKMFDLAGVADHEAQNLSYGQQRRLEIVRALATRPQLLLLDEPAAGMNSSETRDLMHLIAQVRAEFDLTVLLIEHDMKLVMGICEKIVVLDHGMVIAEGTPEQIQKDPKVIEAYLGAPEGGPA